MVEPWRTLLRVPGARAKRLLLGCARPAGGPAAVGRGFPGNDALIGITDPPFVPRPGLLRAAGWRRRRGRFVELTCHPGHLDPTLAGRDGSLADGQIHRRQRELELLRDPAFLEAVPRRGSCP